MVIDLQIIKGRLTGPDYVWFLPGWFKANWWSAGNDTSCSAKEIQATLEHTLGGLGNSILATNLSRIIVSDQVEMLIDMLWYIITNIIHL